MDEQTKRGQELKKNMTPKERRENFWFYYKVHVIVAIFAVLVIAFTIYEFTTMVEDDLTITYFSEAPISNDRVTKLTDFLTQFVNDIDGDAEFMVSISPISGSLNDGGEQGVAAQTKYAAEIGSGHSMGFIVDKSYFDAINEAYPQIIQEYCLISLNPEIAKLAGVNEGEELYWITKALYNSEQGKEKREAMNENAHRVFEVFNTSEEELENAKAELKKDNSDIQSVSSEN